MQHLFVSSGLPPRARRLPRPSTLRAPGGSILLLLLVVVMAAASTAATAAPSPRQATAAEPSPPAYTVHMLRTAIPMRDGVHLAATLYMPDAPAGRRCPVLLEYLPYRKDDGTLPRDYPLHTYFARRGYVTVRVDIRGTGASEGRPPLREYGQQEQRDGEEVIAWLARQKWSNGRVGMFGISWGGFNSIQLAMRNPPALKAIVAVAATEALFNEDVHYFDGMMHVDEFEVQMDLEQAMSRAPDFPLDERTLAARFDNPPWSLDYMRHQRNGPFWREPVRGLDRIHIPVYMIGGMLDGYRDSIPRMLEQLQGPRKALIGPWNHNYPHDAVPGPAVEWRREAVRWWDYWLKGSDTGVMREPPVTVYVQHWHAPRLDLPEIPGEWRSEPSWPPPEARARTLFLHGRALGDAAGESEQHILGYVPSSGVEAGFWWGDLTDDQRNADAYSLSYETDALQEDTAILGRPDVHLNVSASAPLADWFARLSDVAPDGTVTLVAGAGVSGAQRSSMESPSELVPGEIYPLDVRLHLTSWVFPKGHRIRLAVSNAWWPTIWSTPFPMTTRLHLGGPDPSRVTLPIVPLRGEPAPPLQQPEASESLREVTAEGDTWPGQYHVTRDPVSQTTHVRWAGSDTTQFPWGRRAHHEQLDYEVQDTHPEVNRVRGEGMTRFELPARTVEYRGLLELHSDARNFYYSFRRDLLENGKVLRTRTWTQTIPRDLQ